MHGSKDQDGSNLLKIRETLTESMVSQWNSSGIFSQDSIRYISATKSKVYWADQEKHQRISQEGLSSCPCSTTLPVEQETMKKNVWQTLVSYLCMQGNLVKDNGHLLVLVPKRSGILWKKTVHKEFGTKLQKGCCWNSLRADVQFSVLRLHCPEVNSKAKDLVHCRYTMQPTKKRLRLFFAKLILQTSSVFAEQSQTYVKNTKPFTRERSDLLWWDNRVPHSCSMRCMDAGFLSVVENGRYFMTKDTGNLTHFNTAACREYTLPREEAASQPKGWIQGNTIIGPVLEVTTSYLHGKHGVEVRIMSLSRDNTHSWVRISHGSNKFVMNLNNNETEIPEDQLEEYALKLSAKDFACRSKAKAKPQRREPAGSSPRIVPIGRRNWIDIEPGKYSLSDYEVSKKVTHIFFVIRKKCIEKKTERFISGEWRKIFRNNSHNLFIGLTNDGKHVWQQEEE